MAQAQPIQFQLPVKGVVKGLAYSDHPPEAAIDALNVLPFDSTGRMRLSPRTGTAKLWAAAIGGGRPIQGVLQTTLALNPNLITPATQLLNEPFTYANGNLETVSAALWVCKNLNSSFGGAASTQAQVTSNAIVVSAAGPVSCRYTGALVLGTSYIIRATVTFAAIPATSNNFDIMFRADNAALSTNGIVMNFAVSSVAANNVINVRTFNGGTTHGTVTLPASPVAAGVSCLVEVQVSGDTIIVRIDGLTYLTCATTAFNTTSILGFAVNSNSGNITVDNFQVYTGTQLSSYRQTNLTAVSAGNVYLGGYTTQGVITTSGTAAKADTGSVSMASIFGKVYIADGKTKLKTLDIASGVVTDWTSSAGTETATTLGVYQLAAVYRGRLVLAADVTNPQNFVLSRVGVPTDFNYAATDTATAFAGNASKAGQIGEPIVALMPFSDDIMLIGGDHNLWAMRGDPADGGSIDLVSDAVGILGKDAWTKSPDGTIYFVGTGGLFRMSPQGSVPECLSDAKVNEFFRAINRGTQYVSLAWDRDRHQLFIFVVPVNTGTATSIVWDQRTEGFWPIQFPDSHGPLCALVYDGDGPTDRTILMGGRTGYIQQATSAMNDDGTAISSYVYVGPQRVDDSTDAVIDALEVVMGKSPTTDADWNCTLTIVAGQTVEQAFTAPLHTRTKTQTAGGRQSWWYPKVRGNSFFLKLANTTLNKTWNFERATGQMTASSPVRRKV